MWRGRVPRRCHAGNEGLRGGLRRLYPGPAAERLPYRAAGAAGGLLALGTGRLRYLRLHSDPGRHADHYRLQVRHGRGCQRRGQPANEAVRPGRSERLRLRPGRGEGGNAHFPAAHQQHQRRQPDHGRAAQLGRKDRQAHRRQGREGQGRLQARRALQVLPPRWPVPCADQGLHRVRRDPQPPRRCAYPGTARSGRSPGHGAAGGPVVETSQGPGHDHPAGRWRDPRLQGGGGETRQP